VITPQQFLLLLELETGKLVCIVPTAVMGVVAELLEEVVVSLDIFVNAYLLVCVNIGQESNVNRNDSIYLREDFVRNQCNDPCPPCVAGNWCVYESAIHLSQTAMLRQVEFICCRRKEGL